MARYADLLSQETRAGDPFSCHLALKAGKTSHSRITRQFNRRIFYPLIARFKTKGKIAHILDHSWADLLPHLPAAVKSVVTVHDIIPMRFPGELTAAQQARFRRWVGNLHRADAIIAVSEYTKQEIISLLDLCPEKIFVVPNGVQKCPTIDPPSSKNTTEFRIGSIGSILQRKNLEILPQALCGLNQLPGKTVKLIRVGDFLPPKLAQEIRNSIGAENFIELGKVKDHELASFYSSLDCVVIPSLYEGFGLPVLEAMAAQIPIISSNTSSLEEVGGDIPFYFNPEAPEELRNHLQLIRTVGVSPERILAGKARADSLSWRATLEGTFAVYDRVLSSQ